MYKLEEDIEGKIITLYCTYEHYFKIKEILEKDYEIFNITGNNVLLEIKFGFDYDLEISYVSKKEALRIKELNDFEKYQRQCFNKLLKTG